MQSSLKPASGDATDLNELTVSVTDNYKYLLFERLPLAPCIFFRNLSSFHKGKQVIVNTKALFLCSNQKDLLELVPEIKKVSDGVGK